MNGTVKWFSKEKGYGFIYVSDAKEYFFHVSKLKGIKLPNNGDLVSFTLSKDKKNKLVAVNVVITKTITQKTTLPYYSKTASQPYNGKAVYYSNSRGIFWSAIILGGIGAYYGGVIVGVIVGVTSAQIVKFFWKEDEITSQCIRCGGTGQVTAIVDGKIGFQCQKCKKYWSKKDDY